MEDSSNLIELIIKKEKVNNERIKYSERNKYGEIRIHDSSKIIKDSLDDIAKDILKIDGKDKFMAPPLILS